MDAQHRIRIKSAKWSGFSLVFRAFFCFFVRYRKPIYALFHQKIQLRQPCEVSFIPEAEEKRAFSCHDAAGLGLFRRLGVDLAGFFVPLGVGFGVGSGVTSGDSAGISVNSNGGMGIGRRVKSLGVAVAAGGIRMVGSASFRSGMNTADAEKGAVMFRSSMSSKRRIR